MWKYFIERGRPKMIIQRMSIACWIPKATNTHWEYVIHIAFTPQQWLQERATILRYTLIVCHDQTVQNRRSIATVSWLTQQWTDKYSDEVCYSISVTKIRSKQRWGADPVLGQVSWVLHLPACTPLSSVTVLRVPRSHSCVYSVYQLDCVALCCDCNVLKPAGPRASPSSCNNDTRAKNCSALYIVNVTERFCVSLWKPRVSYRPNKTGNFAECFLHFPNISRHIIRTSPNAVPQPIYSSVLTQCLSAKAEKERHRKRRMLDCAAGL